jgi:hypothetical protein
MSTRVEDATGPAPGGARFEFLPLMSDHDLTSAYGHAGLLMGHGPEPWLVWSLSDWLTGAKAELERRGLLKDAKRTGKLLLKEHHARTQPQ